MCARTSTPCAPRYRGLPLQTLSFSTFAQILSAGSDPSGGARECVRPADVALPVPQGGARTSPLRPHPQQCAAVAARHGSLCALLSCVLLERAQDSPRLIFRLWSRSRRLRTFSAPPPHDYQRACGLQRPWRGARARDAFDLCVGVVSSKCIGSSVAELGCTCESANDLECSECVKTC